MAAYRFEVGECVIYEEKRFPNTVRCTELIVVERLAGAGEPHYQLSGDGLASCVLRESQLRPGASLHRDIEDGIARGVGSSSPWAA